MGKMSNLPGNLGNDDDFILLLPFSHQVRHIQRRKKNFK